MANIETTLPGGEVYTAIPPNAAQWARFIGHLGRNDLRVGFRELAQVCCSSHSPEDAAALLAKYPGAIKPIAEAIGELAVDDNEVTAEEQTVLFADMRFRAPSLDEWEDLQEASGKPKSDQHALALALLVKLCDAPGKFQAHAESFPGDVQYVMREVTKITGMQVQIAVKKG